MQELADAQQQLATLFEEQQQGHEQAQAAAASALDAELDAMRHELADLGGALGQAQEQQRADREHSEDALSALRTQAAALQCVVNLSVPAILQSLADS